MNNKTAKSISILMVGTLLSKILGFVRELVVSYKFGAGEITDAFVLTNSIPTVLFSAISVAVGINFIPVYIGISGRDEKNIFTSKLINVYLIVLLIGCILMVGFPQVFLLIFATGMKGVTKQYSVVMLRLVAVSCIPIILSGIFQAYAQAEENFKSTALYGVIVNTTIIIITLVSSENRYYLLSIGTVLANIFGCIYMMLVAYKSGFRYTFEREYKDDNLKELLLLTLPLLVENIASNLSGLVDKNLASFLSSGTISALGYANTLSTIASTVIASAIITATFPRSTKLISEDNIEKFQKSFEQYAGYIVYILVPISVFMIFDSREIVKIIFERGAFDAVASKAVSESLICYSVGVAFGGLQTYLVRGFYAMKETKTPVNIMVFSLICNMAGNLILVHFIKHRGIALSTSFSYIIAVELLLYLLKKQKKINIWNKINIEIAVTILAGIISGMAIRLGLSRLLNDVNVLIKIIVDLFAYVMFFMISINLFSREFRKAEREVVIKIIRWK